MTALTLYLTTSTATTVSTADLLVTTTGGGLTNKNTTIGTNTGYVEIHSQGAGSPTFGASLPNPSGNGWLWDDTTLADNAAILPAGSWTSNISLRLSAGTIVADIYLRVYVRASNGVYGNKSTLTLMGQTIGSTSFTNYSPAHTTSSNSSSFQSGDQLYADLILNITSNSTGSSTAVLKINNANSSTLGNTSAQIVTPGYSIITNASDDAAMRFKLSANQSKNAAMRFRLQTPSASSQIYKDGQMRLRALATRQKDAAMRFKLAAIQHVALFPPATRRTGQFPPAVRRQSY